MNQLASIAWSLFERAQVGITRYTNDITGDEWYARPADVPSPMIWTVGHLAVYRDISLAALTGEFHAPESWRKLFATSSEPSGNPVDYPKPEELLAFLEATQGRLKAWFETCTEEDLAGPVGFDHPFLKTKLQAATMMPMHEAHHTGSLCLVRRLLGKKRVL